MDGVTAASSRATGGDSGGVHVEDVITAERLLSLVHILSYCGLCGEDFREDESRVRLMDGDERSFFAHDHCACSTLPS